VDEDQKLKVRVNLMAWFIYVMIFIALSATYMKIASFMSTFMFE
jgi:hypothetical protein